MARTINSASIWSTWYWHVRFVYSLVLQNRALESSIKLVRVGFDKNIIFLPALTQMGGLGQSHNSMAMFVCMYVGMSAVISSSSSSLSSLEDVSSQTCVGAVPRDLSLYDILSRIRWLLLHSNTVCCTILSVERCSLGNTSLHRDKRTPPLQYSSALYYTILYYTKCLARSQQYQAR